MSNRVVVVGDFNFPQYTGTATTQALRQGEMFKCVQESFISQYVERPSRERAKFDLLLQNWVGQVTEVLVDKPFGTSYHYFY